MGISSASIYRKPYPSDKFSMNGDLPQANQKLCGNEKFLHSFFISSMRHRSGNLFSPTGGSPGKQRRTRG